MTKALQAEIMDYVVAAMEGIRERYLEGEPWAGFLGGYPVKSDTICDYLYVLGLLRQLGVKRLNGEAIETILRRWLPRIDGANTITFYSYRLAETLLLFGPMAENSLVSDLPQAVVAELERAVDSSEILDSLGHQEGGRPNNYWGVLARCEEARRRLGLLDDPGVLDRAVAETEKILLANPHGYFDDSADRRGRFDSYSADLLLFVEPLWDRFAGEPLRERLRRHVALFESIAMENGASVVWGRSTGVLSLCLNMEMHSLALREEWAAEPDRSAALVRHSFACFREDWMQDGLVTAHRGRSPFRYRGPQRWLQMTLDCLGKLALTARNLGTVQAGDRAVGGAATLFPMVDRFHEFSEDGAGVWMFRNRRFAFQLAVVNTGHADADYVPMVRCPGLWDNPVDSSLLVMNPRIRMGEEVHAFSGLPVVVEKLADGLRLVYESELGGAGKSRREVLYRVRDDRLEVKECWEFGHAPDGVAVALAESERPLEWTVEASVPWRMREVDVAGVLSYRSFWGTLQTWREVQMAGRQRMEMRYQIRPKVRVLAIPGDHDYVQCLYGHLADTAVEVDLLPQQLQWRAGLAREWGRRYDVLHIGWPEHLFGGERDERYRRRYLAFLEELGRQPLQVVWTLHNRLPHGGEWEWGERLYGEWAKLTKAALHHSRWGAARMRVALPFGEGCRHAVVPHPHYGAYMAAGPGKAEAERELGLEPVPIRIGVVGRPQKEKQVELVMAAFAAAANPDLELLVTAVRPETVIPDDGRIRAFARTAMEPRERIALYTAACDLLVSCPTGERYLTSGIVADAVGQGVGMICNRWPFLEEIMGEAALYFDDGDPAGLSRLLAGLDRATVDKLAAASQALRAANGPDHCAGQLAEAIHVVAPVAR